MNNSGHSTGTKIIFWAVIAVMVLGSVVSFSAFSFTNPGQQGVVATTPSSNPVSQSLEGTVRKMNLGEDQNAYYLEVAGNLITFLTSSDPKINLDKYAEKAVKIQGFGNGASEDSAPMIEVVDISIAN